MARPDEDSSGMPARGRRCSAAATTTTRATSPTRTSTRQAGARRSRRRAHPDGDGDSARAQVGCLELHKALSYLMMRNESRRTPSMDPADVTINCPSRRDGVRRGRTHAPALPSRKRERGNPVLTPPGDWGRRTYEGSGCPRGDSGPGGEGVRLWNDDLADRPPDRKDARPWRHSVYQDGRSRLGTGEAK